MKNNNELNKYIKLEYGITINEFECIDWNSDTSRKNKKHPLIDSTTELNCYFKSEYGMSYEEYRHTITTKKQKKRILKIR